MHYQLNRKRAFFDRVFLLQVQTLPNQRTCLEPCRNSRLYITNIYSCWTTFFLLKITYISSFETQSFLCLLCIFIVMSVYSYCMFMYLHRAGWHSSATLTEVFPCFFVSCKANARVKPAKIGQGPHSSKLLYCSMYYLFCVVLCTVCV